MKLLALAVFLAVMQAPPPVPRKAPNNDARKGNEHSAKAKDHRNTTAPAPAPAASVIDTSPNAPRPEREPDPAPPSNAEKPIHITELPTVTVNTDGWTRTYVIFTGLLVSVGAVGVCAAVKNLRAINRQVALMEGGLHIDGIRVIELREGRELIFFVKIMNSGPIAATNVPVSIKVELANNIIEYPRDQFMTIPAHGWRECFIRSVIPLGIGDLLKLERGDLLLRISGHVGKEKKQIPYCYKYNPWPFDNRPPDLPQFVVCDFDARIAVGATVKPAGLSMTSSLGTVVARGEIPKASEEPTEPT